MSAFRFENDIGEKIGFLPSDRILSSTTQTAAKSGSYPRPSAARGEIRVAAPEKSSRQAAFFNSIRSFGTSYIRPSVELLRAQRVKRFCPQGRFLYCFAVLFGCRRVILRFAQLKRRIEYHCSEGAISLCGIAAKYHIEQSSIFHFCDFIRLGRKPSRKLCKQIC